MPTRNVDLTEHFDQFIDVGVRSGRFNSVSEIIGEGLRLLEQREQEDRARLDWLRSAAKQGFDQLDQGQGIAFESIDDFSDHLREIGEEVSAEVAADRERV